MCLCSQVWGPWGIGWRYTDCTWSCCCCLSPTQPCHQQACRKDTAPNYVSLQSPVLSADCYPQTLQSQCSGQPLMLGVSREAACPPPVQMELVGLCTISGASTTMGPPSQTELWVLAWRKGEGLLGPTCTAAACPIPVPWGRPWIHSETSPPPKQHTGSLSVFEHGDCLACLTLGIPLECKG